MESRERRWFSGLASATRLKTLHPLAKAAGLLCRLSLHMRSSETANVQLNNYVCRRVTSTRNHAPLAGESVGVKGSWIL